MSPHIARVAPCLVAMLLAIVGCGEDEAAVPEPRALTADAIGYYCNMIVADHLGPKGQIILKSGDEPLWFSSARDAIAFTMLPEEPKDISAIYVNDMGRANWDAPEPDTWIDARVAWYVIGSNRVGGMGAARSRAFCRATGRRGVRRGIRRAFGAV